MKKDHPQTAVTPQPQAPSAPTLDDQQRANDLIAAESPDGGDVNQAKHEEEAFEKESRRLANDGLRQDISERKAYAAKLYKLLAWWMGFVGFCFVVSGFGTQSLESAEDGTAIVTWTFFKLSDNVLIALMAGATINLIGLFAIVAWYLFPKK